MNTPDIRVVLADDHSVVRRGIRDFLTEAGGILVVGEADSGARALEIVAETQPDVAILDIQMPGINGLEAARRLRATDSPPGILILTAFDDPPYIKAALEAGANGYVLKSSSAEEIIDAVRAVFEGKQAYAVQSSPDVRAATMTNQVPRLSEREIEVLQLTAHGLTNKAIGFKLFISDRTVQGHLASIYEKLKASSRTEAVTQAVLLGLLKVTKT